MKRKAILSGVFLLFAAGRAGAVPIDTWTRISLQFTNLTRAEATDSGVGVSTLNSSGGGAHLDQLSLGNATLPGLSLNTVLPVTDPVVSVGGIGAAAHASLLQDEQPVRRPRLGREQHRGARIVGQPQPRQEEVERVGLERIERRMRRERAQDFVEQPAGPSGRHRPHPSRRARGAARGRPTRPARARA